MRGVKGSESVADDPFGRPFNLAHDAPNTLYISLSHSDIVVTIVVKSCQAYAAVLSYLLPVAVTKTF